MRGGGGSFDRNSDSIGNRGRADYFITTPINVGLDRGETGLPWLSGRRPFTNLVVNTSQNTRKGSSRVHYPTPISHDITWVRGIHPERVPVRKFGYSCPSFIRGEEDPPEGSRKVLQKV